MKKVFFVVSVFIFVFCFTSCSDGSGNVDEGKSECGNNKVEEGEVCDGNKKACSAVDSSFTTGEATCKATCDGWDTSKCGKGSSEAECGNDTVEEGEICDGNEIDCSDIDNEKYSGGKAACNQTCDGWITDSCEEITLCGNGFPDEGEVCDGGMVECSALGEGFTSGFAACKEDCSGYITDECAPKCGNEVLEEGEDCEVGDTLDCMEEDWLAYRGGEAVCNPQTCKWDMTTCDPTFNVVPYGNINRMIVNTNNIVDSKKLCVPKEGEEDKCDFDAQYTLGVLSRTPLDMNGNYAGKNFLQQPSIFTGKSGGRYALAVNKGFPPLPEKFFTLFASIAYTPITFQNIEMFGPQVVLMFKTDEVTTGFHKISPFGDESIIIAVGEQFNKTGDIDIDSLCIAAIGFGKKMDVKIAINVMQDGGGGAIHYEGFDIPLYHPTETPIGDVTDLIFEYGLEHVCKK